MIKQVVTGIIFFIGLIIFILSYTFLYDGTYDEDDD